MSPEPLTTSAVNLKFSATRPVVSFKFPLTQFSACWASLHLIGVFARCYGTSLNATSDAYSRFLYSVTGLISCRVLQYSVHTRLRQALLSPLLSSSSTPTPPLSQAFRLTLYTHSSIDSMEQFVFNKLVLTVLFIHRTFPGSFSFPFTVTYLFPEALCWLRVTYYSCSKRIKKKTRRKVERVSQRSILAAPCSE